MRISQAAWVFGALLLSSPALAKTAPAQVDYNGPQPWARTANSGPDAAVGGWWYNLGLTGCRVELIPSAPKHLLVQYVFPGSPADGVVEVGDVMTGAGGVAFIEDHQDGYGPPVFGARGPIGEFAVALEAAQSTSGNGQLAVTVVRGGATLTPSVPVGQSYGEFTSTYPYNCPKSARIRLELLDYLVTTQSSAGEWGSPVQNTFAPLALMTSSVPAHRAAALRCVEFHANTTEAKPTHTWLMNWRYLAAGIVIAEYYLQTNEPQWVAELQEIYDFLMFSQYFDRSQIDPASYTSHPGSQPTDDLGETGGWGHNPGFEGYGPMAMTTGQGTVALSLMERCGIKVRRKRLDASYAFLRRGTGTNGYLWYGDDPAGNNNWADTGRTGASALGFFLAPYPDASYRTFAREQTTLIRIHPQSFPDTHGSPPMGMGYVAAAASFDQPALRSVMDANRFWFALSQCHDGTYYYQPNRDNAGYGGDSRIVASAVTAFIFSIPLANLKVTGRP